VNISLDGGEKEAHTQHKRTEVKNQTTSQAKRKNEARGAATKEKQTTPLNKIN